MAVPLDDEASGRPRRAVPPQFLLCTIALALLPLGASWWRPYRPKAAAVFALTPASLAALDRCVQARFAVPPTRGDFGMRRIAEPPAPFAPLNRYERAAVSALQRDQKTVLLYVGSPTIVPHSPVQRQVEYGAVFQIKGPVSMTQQGTIPSALADWHGLNAFGAAGRPPLLRMRHAPTDLPARTALTVLARQVFAAARLVPPSTAVGAEATTGHWHLSAVPLRASGKTCVSCHNSGMFPHRDVPLPAGDPLGVAVYAFSRAKPTQTAPRRFQGQSQPNY